MSALAEELEADTGPRGQTGSTERLCVATRTVKPIEGMIRFVVGPDGWVVPDLKRKLPGRGVWVTATREALGEAVRRNAFARGFKRTVSASADLPGMTEGLLERAALDALSMAHKAGLVETGFARVATALGDHDIAALLHALDAAPDGVRKLAQAARQRLGERAESLPVLTAFTSAQLDLALGRANVIHAALLAGPASEAFLVRCRSLLAFRGCEPGARADERRG
jgi:predicted RNA-binding protein YlxR (DUF448 family)